MVLALEKNWTSEIAILLKSLAGQYQYVCLLPVKACLILSTQDLQDWLQSLWMRQKYNRLHFIIIKLYWILSYSKNLIFFNVARSVAIVSRVAVVSRTGIWYIYTVYNSTSWICTLRGACAQQCPFNQVLHKLHKFSGELHKFSGHML